MSFAKNSFKINLSNALFYKCYYKATIKTMALDCRHSSFKYKKKVIVLLQISIACVIPFNSRKD